MRETRVGAPVGHQPSANPHVVIPVQLEPAVLPSYTIPPNVGHRRSVLGLAARSLATSQFLLAPLPALVAGLLPGAGTSLHGERPGDLPSLYEHIGTRNVATDEEGPRTWVKSHGHGRSSLHARRRPTTQRGGASPGCANQTVFRSRINATKASTESVPSTPTPGTTPPPFGPPG